LSTVARAKTVGSSPKIVELGERTVGVDVQ
jgi:hypothetical protein